MIATAASPGRSFGFRFGDSAFARPEKYQQPCDTEDRETAGQAHDVHHRRAIFTACRIVVVAVEQQLIDWRTDLARGSFDQAESPGARGILGTVVVARALSRC